MIYVINSLSKLNIYCIFKKRVNVITPSKNVKEIKTILQKHIINIHIINLSKALMPSKFDLR